MAPPDVAELDPANVQELLLLLLLPLFGECFVPDVAVSVPFVAEEAALVLGGEMGVEEVERPRLLVRYDVAPGTLPADAGGVASP